MKNFFLRGLPGAICLFVAIAISPGARAQTNNYFGTSGTITGNVWSTNPAGPYTSALVTTGGPILNFNNAGSATGGTIATVVGINFGAPITWTAGGTIGAAGINLPINVSTGINQDFGGSQGFTTSATGAFTKNGGGSLALAGGTFAGGFTLNSGAVIARGVNALGNGTLTLNGGTVAANANRDFTGKFTGGITIGGDIQFGEVTGNISLASGSSNLTFTNNISLGNSLRTLTLGGSGTMAFGGVIANTGSNGLTFTANNNGTGRFDITSTANTFTGPININGVGDNVGVAEVRFTTDGSIGNATNTITIDGGRFGIVSGGTVTVANTRNIAVGSLAGTSITAPGAAGILTYNGVIANKNGATGILAKQGAGILSLGGVSTYTGATSINNGTIQLTTGNDRLPTSTTVSLGQTASTNVGRFDLNGFSQQIAGLATTTGTGTANNTVTSATAATLTILGSGSNTFGSTSTANAGVIGGAISLIKSGSGTQTFGGSTPYTYTGTTTLSGGVLQLGNANVLPSATPIILDGGTFSTGSPAGFSQAVGTLNLNANSTIALGSGVHSLSFAASNGIVWAGTTLTVTGWAGTVGASGTAGKLFVGANASGLTATQLAKITFTGYPAGATILSTGEVVPAAPVVICPAITANLTGTTTICAGNSTNLTATISGGTAPYSLTYSDGTSTSVVSGTTITVSPAASTTYTIVAVTDANSCTATVSGLAAVTIDPQPTIANAGVSQTISVGGVASLSANTPTTGTGSWSVTSGPSLAPSQFGDPSSPTTSFTPAGGVGDYGLTWTIRSGSCPPSGSSVTITVIKPTVNLSVSSASGSEAGQTAITVTATASASVAGNQTVDLTVSGTGIMTSDYTLSNTTISIPNGQTAGSVTFTVVDDLLVEGSETATLAISNPSANIALGGTTSQDITITDNDLAPRPDLTVALSGPSSATVNLPYTYSIVVSNIGAANATGISVSFALPTGVTYSNSAATNGFTLDTSTPGIISFSGGSLTQGASTTLTIGVRPTVAGTIVSGPASATVDPANTIAESIELNNLSTQTVTTTVVNPTVNLSVSINTASETNPVAIVVTATSSAPVLGDQTVNLAVSGTGIMAGDYTLSNTTITILDGQTTGSVLFTAVDDALVEGSETAILTISNPSAGIALGTPVSQSISITDNDVAPQPDLVVTIAGPSSATVNVPYTYSVVISNVGTLDAANVAVQFMLPNTVAFSGASAGDNNSGYIPSRSGQLVTLSGGTLAVNESVTLLIDVRPTATGTVTSGPGSATIDPNNTISESNETNNTSTQTVTTSVVAPTVNLSVSSASASETSPMAITVTATSSVSVLGNQTVDVVVSGAGITAADYTLSNTTITILDGQTTGFVLFTAVDDALVEGSETATLVINNPSANIALGGTTSQDIAITDNDFTPALSVNPSSLTFTTTAGTASAEQSYVVSATALTTAVTVTAPAGVEVSQTSGSGFVGSLILPQSTTSATIFARLSAGATAANPFSGTITNSSGSLTATVAISGTVNAANLPPVAPTFAPQSGTVAVAFSYTVPAFTDESASLTYVITGLPAGLVADNATRIISGTPTATGTSTVTVVATDPQSATTAGTFTITINTNQAPVSTTIANQTATVGTAFSFTVPAFTDPENQALIYAATGLPASLAFNSTTRVISGTPTVAGVSSVTITATDPASNTASTTFSLSVNAAPALIRITEFMHTGTVIGGAGGEFVEITNIGTTSVDLTGWSFDDASAMPGLFSISSIGVLAPGESAVITEATAAAFRATWYLPATVKVVGGNNQNLSATGSDAMNIFDASGTRIDQLVYNANNNANGTSAWTTRPNLGTNTIANWQLSVVADAQDSYVSATGNTGNPGGYYQLVPRVNVVQSGGSTAVTEGGATDTYTIALNTQPTADVTVTISAGSQLTLNATTLTFTPTNYSTAQTVTVTAVDDALVNGTRSATITQSVTSTDVSYNAIPTAAVSVTITDNDVLATIPPGITVANTTTAYLSLPATGPGFVSGVINDPTDPASTLGIDFTLTDADTPVNSLTTTLSTTNSAVVPVANLVLSGTGSLRNLKITPTGVGSATITVGVTDGVSSVSYVVSYGASAASTVTSRFHTGASDASTAVDAGNGYMFVADDENQVVRLYNRTNSGLPATSFDYNTSLAVSNSNPEVDIESSVLVGNRIYWLGSHSNSANSGAARPNRYRLFATDVTGSGITASLTYVGRYDGLRTDLLAWDANNTHGLGANYFGFAASAATGVIPEASGGTGFNIEGLTIAPDGTTGYVAFRAPIVPTTARTKALIVPVTNFTSLVLGNPAAGPATFGAPIQLDLGGRGIREIKRSSGGDYLIVAGSPSGFGAAPNDFRLYTWTGVPTDAPVLRTADLSGLSSNVSSIESIVELPATLTNASSIQVLADNGDADFYNNGTIAKDLPQNNFKKFRSDYVTLGAPANTAPTVANAVGPQSATVGVGYTLSVANTFTDAESPNNLTLTVAGLPSGLSLMGTSITGSPSTTVGSPFSVTLTATDPGSLSASTVFAFTVSPAATPVVSMTSVVISQVYGSGGNTGATFRNDYVELFNRSASTVSINGWSVQYASATGTGSFNANSVSLTGSLAPGQYYLVQLASAGTAGATLPTADVVGSINMSGTAGKVILVNSTAGVACNGSSTTCSSGDLARIVDLVGYGNANYSEGNAPAPGLTVTTAAFRNLNGCMDTNNNAADFTATTPAPRNTGSPLNVCGMVTPVASLVASPTALSGFATVAGTASAEQSYTLSSANLSGAISVSAPAGVEVSLSSGGGFGSAVSVPASGTTTIVYVRLTGVTAGSVSGVITNVSGSLTASVSVSGSVTAANTAPTVANAVGPQSATVGVGYTLSVANTFTDAESPSNLTLTVSGLPSGLSLVGTSITGTPSTTVGSPFSVTLTATDPGSLSASTVFSLSVAPAAVVNTAPTVANAVGPQSATVGVGYTLSVANTFTDAESPNNLTLTVAGLPAGLSLTGTSITGSPSTTVGSPFSVTLTATDPGSLSASTVFTITVSPAAVVNTAPTVANAVGPQSATVGVGYTLSVANTFTDAESPNNLTLTVAGLPAGLSLVGTTISGSPSTTVGSPFSVTLTATDPGSLSASTVFSLSVAPAAVVNTAPTVANAVGPQSATVGVGYTLSVANTFTDAESPNNLTLTVAGLPSGLSLMGTSITGSPSTTVGSPFSVTLTATDPGSLSASTVFAFTVSPAATPVVSMTGVVISQIYGGGGNSGATYRSDYIELFNRTNAPININGWSVQYAAAASANWTPTSLTGSIPAGGYYLVQQATTGTTAAVLPTADAFGTINLSGTVGKVALVTVSTALSGTCPVGSGIVDFVGYGSTATCSEGSSPASGSPSASMAFLRKVNGCTDTDNNAADFMVGSASPRNSASPVNVCGTVTPVASLVASPTALSGFATVAGTASAEQSYTLSSANLSGAISVSAPAGVEVSLSSGGGFGSAVSVPASGTTTIVYVRLTGVTAGSVSGVITNVSGSLTASVSVSGSVTAANTAPTVANAVGPQSATVGVGYTLSVANTFTDAESPSNLTLTVSGLPSGLSLVGTSITGTPSTTVGSPFSVTLTATDPGSLSASTVFSLSVAPATVVNTAPTVANAVGPQSATVGVGYTLSVANTFTDAESPNNLTLTVAGLPAGLSLVGTTISGSPSTTVGSPFSVTLTATDPGGLSASTVFTITVSPAAVVNTAPTVANAVGPQSATVGVGYTLSVANTFTDAQTPNNLTLTASGLPAGLSLNGMTISGSPSTTVGSPYSVTLTATDPGGLSASTVFTLMVSPAAVVNTAPTVANAVGPQSATVGVGYTLSVANTFTDAESPNNLTLTVAGLPAGLSLTGTSITGSPSTTVGSPFSVTLTATDPGSLSASTVFTITVSPAAVVNTAPTVANAVGPQSATVGVGYTLSIANTFTDAQTPNNLTLTVAGLPAGLSLTGTTISGSPSTTVGSPFSVTLTATDPGGLSASTVFTITVSPAAVVNTAPTVANAVGPQSATVGVGYTLSIANTFTDAQTPNSLVLSASGLPMGLNLTGTSISGSPSTTVGSPYSVTLTATDPGGLSASTVFAISVSPASMTVTPGGPFAITGVSTLDCTPVGNRINITFNPQYAGLTGSVVSFSVVNELAATTNPGPYALSLYSDNPVITLQAVQSGVSTTFAYNWLAACNGGGNPTPGNTAPTVANAVGPQSATVGVSYTLSLVSTFTDAQTPNGLMLSAAGLPAGLSLTGTSISGSPSTTVGSPYSVTLTATDPGGLSASTVFAISVSPASMTVTPGGPFAITGVSTLDCTPVGNRINITFNPQYAGLTGSVVSFSVVNELAATTNPGPYALSLYSDNPVITLQAVQSGVSTTFAYNWLAACNGGGNPTPGNTAPTVANAVGPQSATVGVGYTLSLVSTFTDAQTPNGLMLSAAGLPAGLSLTGTSISGSPSTTVGSPYSVTLTATDPGGLGVSLTFSLAISPAPAGTTPTGTFSITGVTTESCSPVSAGQRSVNFTPRYAGLTGSVVSFSVVNELAATTNPGPYSLRLYTDNPVITLQAVQSGVSTTFAYNWLVACNALNGGSRQWVAEPGATLSVTVLGNPTQRETVAVEIRGGAGQRLVVTTTDSRGRLVSEQVVAEANAIERQAIEVGQMAGIYILQVSTPTKTVTTKILKR